MLQQKYVSISARHFSEPVRLSKGDFKYWLNSRKECLSDDITNERMSYVEDVVELEYGA